MKRAASRQAADALEPRLRRFGDELMVYQPNDVSALGNFAQTIVMGHEYWVLAGQTALYCMIQNIEKLQRYG